jgi:hypothetical protein
MTREFTDDEMFCTAQHMFYEIVAQYINFYKKGYSTKLIKITLFDELELILYWTKLKTSQIMTKYIWLNNYSPNEDDLYLLGQLKEYFLPKTIKNIIGWYTKLEKRLD